jgi:chaperonin GroEL (HSP60 family)
VQRGYRNALEIARSEVETLACSVDGHRHETARSALTGNVAGGEKERFSEFAVEIVEAVGRPRPEVFGISTISQGEIEASRLVDGVVLDRNRITDRRMPRRVDNGTVLVLDGQDEGGLRTLELNERYNASVSNHAELAALQDTDAGRRARIIQKLREHDVDIVVAKQGIEKEYAVELANHEIVGIDGVTRLYLSRVARATGAEPVKRTEDFDTESLGHVGTLREVAGDPLGEQQKRRRMVILEDCVDPGAMSMLLHGVWGQLADNTTTEIRKAAVAVARAEGLGHAKPGIVPGGGATDTRVSMSVRNEADTVDSREQLAQRAFADAVEMLVFTLGKNIGYDPYAVRPELREANNNTSVPFGIVFPQREIVDTVDAGVVDPVATKLRSYVVATEAATLLLRIDDAIPATFSESAPDPNDTIYEDAAEQQQSYIEKHEDTRYNR